MLADFGGFRPLRRLDRDRFEGPMGELPKGATVYYLDRDGTQKLATIMKVHYDDPPPARVSIDGAEEIDRAREALVRGGRAATRRAAARRHGWHGACHRRPLHAVGRRRVWRAPSRGRPAAHSDGWRRRQVPALALEAHHRRRRRRRPRTSLAASAASPSPRSSSTGSLPGMAVGMPGMAPPAAPAAGDGFGDFGDFGEPRRLHAADAGDFGNFAAAGGAAESDGFGDFGGAPAAAGALGADDFGGFDAAPAPAPAPPAMLSADMFGGAQSRHRPPLPPEAPADDGFGDFGGAAPAAAAGGDDFGDFGGAAGGEAAASPCRRFRRVWSGARAGAGCG